MGLETVLPQLSTEGNELLEERLALLQQQIKKLDSLEKGIILLYLEDRSYDEIAAITGLTPTNVGTRLSRIKEKLKKQMKQEA